MDNSVEGYFNWLVDKVFGRGHVLMLRDLFNKDYNALFEQEKELVNGAIILLRCRYWKEERVSEKFNLVYPINCLEALVVLSEKMAITIRPELKFDSVEWFWIIAEELGVTKYSDDRYVFLDGAYGVSEELTHICDVIIYFLNGMKDEHVYNYDPLGRHFFGDEERTLDEDE